MKDIEISVSLNLVLEQMDERDIIEYYGHKDLFDYFTEKQAYEAIEDNFDLDADRIVDAIFDDITIDKIKELYNSIDK